MNWLKRNPCDLIKYTLVGIHDAIRSNNFCHHGDCTTCLSLLCKSDRFHDTQKGTNGRTHCKAMSALRTLCPEKVSGWPGTYLHMPLIAPLLSAGTGCSQRFFSVDPSLIFLNTQDMCFQCLTCCLGRERQSRLNNIPLPLGYCDMKNSCSFLCLSYTFITQLKNQEHSVLGSSPFKENVLKSHRRFSQEDNLSLQRFLGT